MIFSDLTICIDSDEKAVLKFELKAIAKSVKRKYFNLK